MGFVLQGIQQHYYKTSVINPHFIHTLGMKPPTNVPHVKESHNQIIQQTETLQITQIQQQQQIADIF